MSEDPILIAGGGVAGLTLALTCHQLGVPVQVFESARELRPLGVGINVQPNAVRELIDLGLGDHLPNIGVATQEYGFFTKHGKEIWNEPRGLEAGYSWPQYSVHRGRLQLMLHEAVVDRLGSAAVQLGSRVTGYVNDGDSVRLQVEVNGEATEVRGPLVVAADGLHSAIRAQMVPDEGPPIWGGAILWRGCTRAKPFRTGASMAIMGKPHIRFVTYPISDADPDSGEALINWIAETTFDPSHGWAREDWNRRADKADFIDNYRDWDVDWIDPLDPIERTAEVFEYPMVDRDPLDSWTDGRVTLMGDAAHIMYPVGSNGASQAIIDARKIGRGFLDHGVNPDALAAFENEVRPASGRMILAGRGSGPDSVVTIVEERCGGEFDDINDVMPYDERAALSDKYKKLAGFDIETLNARPPIIESGSRVG